MGKRQRIRIKGNNGRFLISDVLPYEVPPFFSNQQIVAFLNKFNLYSEEGVEKILSDTNLKKNPIALECLRILVSFEKELKRSIPYSFIINSGKGKKRTISVIHPLNQCLVAEYVTKYAPLIIKHCSQSSFSLRKPVRVATKKYYKDDYHNSVLNKTDGFEQNNKEYEVLKSYFVYNKNSNLYKFFDSVTFLEAEKKFSKVRCLDIHKCFDNIYTHSIDWAVVGKKNSKDNIERIYTSRFDKLMQTMNYNETNGIVIGPEFSRVFAEMILSSIDSSLQTALANNDIKYKKDYLIFRYVDDYFIFFNEDKVINAIQDELALALKEYKLFLNEEKVREYNRPIITPTSIAKAHILDLIKSRFPSISTEIDNEKKITPKYNNATRSSDFIQAYKSIMSESGVTIKDVISYSLMLIEKSIKKSLAELRKAFGEEGFIPNAWKKDVVYVFSLYFEILFFLVYTSDSTTAVINSVRILDSIATGYCAVTGEKNLPPFLADYVYSQIVSYVEQNIDDKRMECIYLISLASSIIRHYCIPNDIVSKFVDKEMDYFSCITVLRYCHLSGQTELYKELIDDIYNKSIERIKAECEYISSKHAEVPYLVLDLLCCPLFEEDRRINILKEYRSILSKDNTKPKDNSYYRRIIEFIEENMFCPTKWNDFCLGYELVQKKGLSVY